MEEAPDPLYQARIELTTLWGQAEEQLRATGVYVVTAVPCVGRDTRLLLGWVKPEGSGVWKLCVGSTEDDNHVAWVPVQSAPHEQGAVAARGYVRLRKELAEARRRLLPLTQQAVEILRSGLSK